MSGEQLGSGKDNQGKSNPKTGPHDELIAKKQRLIDLLQEQRAALITHAVTKGLDPNIPMKDSGVEWLGKIPAHWGIKQLKHVTHCLDGQRIPLNAEQRGQMQGEYPILRGTDFKKGGFDFY